MSHITPMLAAIIVGWTFEAWAFLYAITKARAAKRAASRRRWGNVAIISLAATLLLSIMFGFQIGLEAAP